MREVRLHKRPTKSDSHEVPQSLTMLRPQCWKLVRGACTSVEDSLFARRHRVGGEDPASIIPLWKGIVGDINMRRVLSLTISRILHPQQSLIQINTPLICPACYCCVRASRTACDRGRIRVDSTPRADHLCAHRILLR